MVGPSIEYVKVIDHDSKRHYHLSARSSSLLIIKNRMIIHPRRLFQGRNSKANVIFPCLIILLSMGNKELFAVILEESVSLEEGTGIVHAAPAFGEVDFYACQRAGIDPVCPVDNNGRLY